MLKDIVTTAQIEQLRELIQKCDNIVCVCHQNPDGDALGSSLAWAEVLRTGFGKSVQVIVPDQYPDYIQWLPGANDIVRYDKYREGSNWTLANAGLICCLDFNEATRTGDMTTAFQASKAPRLMIDHHLKPTVDCDWCLSKPAASSTCELVFRLTWQLGLFEKMGKAFATCIYCGMMTDTGAFTYNSSDPDLFFIVGELLTKNINKDRIYRNVYHNFSENRMRLTGYVMYEKLVVDAAHHASYFTLTRSDLSRFHFMKGDAEGLVNIPLQMKGHRLSISLREDTERDNLVWVSMRSVDNVPCNEIASQFFNGGGHHNAAGGRLNCTIGEAVEVAKRAIEAFDDYLK